MVSNLARESAPYAPPSNVISVIQRFRDRNLPTEMDAELLRDIGVASGNVNRTLFALSFMGLIDEYYRPTHLFSSIQMADDSEYQSILGSIVQNAYQEIFKIADPSKDPQHIIENAFRRFQPASQRRRMAVLFLGLCSEAGLAVLDTPRQRSAKVGAQVTRQKQQPRSQKDKPVRVPAKQIDAQEPMVKISEVSELRRQYIATLIKRVESIEVPDNELLDRIERLIREEEHPPQQGIFNLKEN